MAQKKRFCLRGHDTSIKGRTSNGTCKDCHLLIGRKDPTKDSRLKQFCLNGHDTFIVGRYITDKSCIKCAKERSTEWRVFNLDKANGYARNWYNRNIEKARIIRRFNNVNRIKRIPEFGQEGIMDFYLNRPKNMTVDHIIPLQGRKVSGLHVIWNLQYLTKSQNSKKHNIINLLKVSDLYGKVLQEIQ